MLCICLTIWKHKQRRPPSEFSIEQCKHYSISQELLRQSKSQLLETWKVPKQIWKLKKIQNLKLYKRTIGGAMSQKVENWNKTHLENRWMIMWNWKIAMTDTFKKVEWNYVIGWKHLINIQIYREENEHEWFRV